MISFHQISKRFGGVQALKDVSFAVERGSIHAVVGENGAGKSTLMKIAAGIQPLDSGEMRLAGKVVTVPSPRRARELGIALVPQEPALCPNLSVEENLSLGNEPQKYGFVSRGAMRGRAETALARAALDVRPDAAVETLSSASRHLLQIARALAEDAQLLILDEPTAALSEGEAANLFKRLRGLRDEGVTILYISHRLPEIFALCDAITTLRDGSHIATGSIKSVRPEDIVAQMVGRALENTPGKAPPENVAPRTGAGYTLEVEHLTRTGAFSEVSFALRPGEIVGMAGLVGSGRSEIARCIFGLDVPSSGTVRLEGQTFTPRDTGDAIKRGIALVPEDRREQGLVMGLSVRENLMLPALALGLKSVSRSGWVRSKDEENLVMQRIRDLGIKTSSADASVETLSGGNQQKVVIGKWLSINPRLLLVDEPTQGVDVGAKAQVHSLLRELATRGCAILMISSDLPEVLQLSDRILVMRAGRLAGELPQGSSAESVMRLAALG